MSVLEGKVTENGLKAVQDSRLRFALGAGTFSNIHRIGETFLFDQICHVSWVENGQLHSETKPNAKTPFLMGIGLEEPIGRPILLNQVISLDQLYEQLSLKHPNGFALLGNFRMKIWSGTYLKRPPIFQQNVNEYHDLYWAEQQQYPNALMCLLGVVIPPTGQKFFPKSEVAKAFYKNPHDTSTSAFLSHTHGAVADQLSHDFLKTPPTLGSVRHTLTQSIVQEGSYLLFPLDAIESFF
ncbi:MAG: hypothetical protein KGQ49_02445 [Verrucomicrobia bacterium]|nr:hypothetical protein [Verrucomicrobiota bacterium]MBU6446241.1 hypothetical protein [Verrucomicrobiota bacterium]MDE3047165.1 hypothetical protein [Verrucomicrobiota bacterium]